MNINQLSQLVNNKLKVADEKISTVERFDWNTLKRAPQFLKQKTNIGSHTIDEEFDNMKEDLFLIEKRFQTLNKYITIFAESNFTMLDTSKSIGQLVKEVFDPYNSLSKSVIDKLGHNFRKGISPDGSVFSNKSTQLVFEEEYGLWEDAESYIDCIKCIEPAIKSELELLAKTIDAMVNEVLLLCKNIKKKIKLRSYALMDYDKIASNHEVLILKQKSKELSVKEGQQIFSLERKLEAAKHEYDKINDILKRELPYFFKLVNLILSPTHLMVYYVQLMVSYQIHTNLLSIAEIFNIDLDQLKKKNFSEILSKEFDSKNRPASDLINKLSIVNFHENFLNNITSNFQFDEQEFISPEKQYDPRQKYCQALFHFNSDVKGDIAIKPGDIIEILDQTGSWWKGKLDDKVGLFPGNYVRELS